MYSLHMDLMAVREREDGVRYHALQLPQLAICSHTWTKQEVDIT